MSKYRLMTYNELHNYVEQTKKTGKYYGQYVGGFLDKKTCEILFETPTSSICHYFISQYMLFVVEDK